MISVRLALRHKPVMAWVALPLLALFLTSCDGSPSPKETFEKNAEQACSAFVRSRPSRTIAPTYQLELRGLLEDIKQRDKLIETIARLTPPAGRSALVAQFLAALRAIDPLQQAGVRILRRTHIPIIPRSIGEPWGRHTRRAQQIAQQLRLPACVIATNR